MSAQMPGAESRTAVAAPAAQPGAAQRMRGPVSACVVNRNGLPYIERCLIALRGAGAPIAEVLVVDDASTDESPTLVEQRFPDARVLRRGVNAGPGAARNEGFRAALHDLVLFVDNDVYISPDCPALLADALARYDLAVMAVPTLLHAAQPETVQFDGADSHFLGLQTLLHAERPLAEVPTADRLTDTSMVSACFMLDRRRWRAAAEGEPFDESFFMYYEDHDLGYRSRALGVAIACVPRARCLHDEGTVGVSLRQLGSYSAVRVHGLIQNRWQLLLKNYELRTLAVLSPMLLVYELVQLAAVVKKRWLRHWLAALAGLGRNSGSLWRERRRLTRLRMARDRHILRGGPLPYTARLAASPAERTAQRWLDAVARAYWRVAQRLV